MGLGVPTGPRGGTHRACGSNIPTPRYQRHRVTHAGSYLHTNVRFLSQLYFRQLRVSCRVKKRTYKDAGLERTYKGGQEDRGRSRGLWMLEDRGRSRGSWMLAYKDGQKEDDRQTDLDLDLVNYKDGHWTIGISLWAPLGGTQGYTK